MSLRNNHWLTLRGDPVTGRTPPRLVPMGSLGLTDFQLGWAANYYESVARDNALSLAKYRVQECVAPDGTRVRIVSNFDVDTVYVWPAGEEEPAEGTPFGWQFLPVASDDFYDPGAPRVFIPPSGGARVDPGYIGGNWFWTDHSAGGAERLLFTEDGVYYHQYKINVRVDDNPHLGAGRDGAAVAGGWIILAEDEKLLAVKKQAVLNAQGASVDGILISEELPAPVYPREYLPGRNHRRWKFSPDGTRAVAVDGLGVSYSTAAAQQLRVEGGTLTGDQTIYRLKLKPSTSDEVPFTVEVEDEVLRGNVLKLQPRQDIAVRDISRKFKFLGWRDNVVASKNLSFWVMHNLNWSIVPGLGANGWYGMPDGEPHEIPAPPEDITANLFFTFPGIRQYVYNPGEGERQPGDTPITYLDADDEVQPVNDWAITNPDFPHPPPAMGGTGWLLHGESLPPLPGAPYGRHRYTQYAKAYIPSGPLPGDDDPRSVPKYIAVRKLRTGESVDPIYGVGLGWGTYFKDSYSVNGTLDEVLHDLDEFHDSIVSQTITYTSSIDPLFGLITPFGLYKKYPHIRSKILDFAGGGATAKELDDLMRQGGGSVTFISWERFGISMRARPGEDHGLALDSYSNPLPWWPYPPPGEYFDVVRLHWPQDAMIKITMMPDYKNPFVFKYDHSTKYRFVGKHILDIDYNAAGEEQVLYVEGLPDEITYSAEVDVVEYVGTQAESEGEEWKSSSEAVKSISGSCGFALKLNDEVVAVHEVSMSDAFEGFLLSEHPEDWSSYATSGYIGANDYDYWRTTDPPGDRTDPPNIEFHGSASVSAALNSLQLIDYDIRFGHVMFAEFSESFSRPSLGASATDGVRVSGTYKVSVWDNGTKHTIKPNTALTQKRRSWEGSVRLLQTILRNVNNGSGKQYGVPLEEVLQLWAPQNPTDIPAGIVYVSRHIYNQDYYSASGFPPELEFAAGWVYGARMRQTGDESVSGYLLSLGNNRWAANVGTAGNDGGADDRFFMRVGGDAAQRIPRVIAQQLQIPILTNRSGAFVLPRYVA